MKSPAPNHPRIARSAFTLIELMVVIGIIAVMTALIVPAVSSLSRSNGLSTGGRMIANLLTIARSEAINRRTLIRFEVATRWPLDSASAYRKVTLVQHDVATGTDTQLTKWETIPDGIVFHPTAAAPATGTDFFALNQTQSPALKIAGQDVPTVYIEFRPSGALNVALADSPVRMRLVEGVPGAAAASITLTAANNWFDATIDALVGRIKISRP